MLDERPAETTLYSLDSGPPSKGGHQRNSERHVSLLRVGCLVIGERRELCLIKNISAGGMLIRVYSRVEPEVRLSVELKQGESVSGVARWVEGDCVGVGFDEPIDVVGLISSSAEGPRPRMPRIEVSSPASLREGAQVHRTTVVNISQGGVKLILTAELPVSAEVVVSMTGLSPMPGVVRWRDEDAYGVTFNRALGLSELVQWLHAQQERQRSRAAG